MIFTKSNLLGLGLVAKPWFPEASQDEAIYPEFYLEKAKKLPTRHFDVVVAGGGTAGVICAIASARQGGTDLACGA